MLDLKYKDRVITITANRNLSDKDVDVIEAAMKKLVEDPTVSKIYFGGARGGDTVALKAARKHRKTPFVPSLIVVVPCTLNEQPPAAVMAVNECADSLIELKTPIIGRDVHPGDINYEFRGYKSYHLRNQYMVDKSTEVHGFWNGDLRSGTASCMKYAKKAEKPVFYDKIEGTDK